MTTHTHEITHGATVNGRNSKCDNSLPHPKLPLLGSNQDSSDPESQAATGALASRSAQSRQNATERDTRHTKSHTVRHTPPVYRSAPRPLALGGGNVRVA